MIFPSYQRFQEGALKGDLITVGATILADLETPVSAFLKMGLRSPSFLLESVEGGERIARYSFLGADPSLVVRGKGDHLFIETKEGVQTVRIDPNRDPLHYLQLLMDRNRYVSNPELPRLCGGLVGYVGYDVVRYFERLPDWTEDDLQLPDIYFLMAESLIVFDHLKRQIQVLINQRIEGDPSAAYHRAAERVEELVERLKKPLRTETLIASPVLRTGPSASLKSNMDRSAFEKMVRRAKEYIFAGDVIQTVLSQRFEKEVQVDPIHIYRALRTINPSPYMFYLDFGDLKLIGSSPEILVSYSKGVAVTRPLADTRPRGQTSEEDKALEKELLSDPKERAEHIMLVDLGRNDLGRVCKTGSVKVTELMAVERYSHVMHIYSTVEGILDRSRFTPFDLLRATFPAGTVTGAPKIRAMEIIEELEPVKRGPYAGSVGYFSFNGEMDMAITIRTIVLVKDRAYIQAGAGIVADSDPAREYYETVNKARALVAAIEMAEKGLERVPLEDQGDRG
ncbi:MAG: anthranilate synthase component I [Armatimonadetes bacterium]|nr:anthranilate synthase component I [Armatimonadota bacterium]MDW8121220.1 anthranilate synthase component I [Armatimonadota bacterium]